jgi:tight adherence protein B
MNGWVEALVAVASAAVVALIGWRFRAERIRRRAVIGARSRRPRRPVVAPAALLDRPLWQLIVVGGLVAATAGVLMGGPVAGVGAGVYAVLAVRSVARRQAMRRQRSARADLLDRLAGLAADLRAGLPMPSALATAGEGMEDEPLLRLTHAAAGLAEETGAPLADLVERIETDARATDRALAAADAQAAGARATAVLLAGLPLGGVALGFGIGVDPLDVLLHTPIGVACASGAVVLQLLGLAWTNRLTARPR